MPHLKQFLDAAGTAVLTRSSIASLGRNGVLVNVGGVGRLSFKDDALAKSDDREVVFADPNNGFNSLFLRRS